MDFALAASRFWQEFSAALPTLLLYFVPAWLACCVLLSLVVRALKPILRGHVSRFDEVVTKHARALRYRLPAIPEQHPADPQAPPTPQEAPTERVLLTWFFRFWTNFGSSPALAILSILVAISAFSTRGVLITSLETPSWWFFPGVCFAGGTWLSFVTKRVFKRARPEREFGSFGHKMSDSSFPSGHSLTAVCFWGGILTVLVVGGAGTTALIAAGALGLAVTFLTGLSRIYLGVHWPSDVVGGYMMALIWGAVCYFALRGVL